jgi:drug/metabolite transporter (DMT)-like permease
MTAVPTASADELASRATWLAGVALATTGAVLFAGKGIVAKLIYRHGVDAQTLIALRMVFSLPFFVIAAAWVAYRTPRTPADGTASNSPWQPNDAWRVIGLGLLGYYLASYLDFLGLQYVSVGLERVILYLNPTLVLLISAIALRRPISRRQWLAMSIAYCGVILVFWHDLSASGADVPLGSALVFGSTVAYSIYLVSCGEIVRRLGAIRLMAWAMIVSCIACIVQALILSPAALFSQPAAVYQLSMMNAVLCTVMPVFLTMMGVERIGTPVASQLGMIGPAATIGMGAMFLGEAVDLVQLIGTAIVIAGIFVLTARLR